MSLDQLQISIEIFWPVLLAGVAIAGAFLATIAIMEGINKLLTRLK